MDSDWKIVQSELLFQSRWIELYEDKVEVRPGKTTLYTWYITPDVAVIVPFIDNDKLVMIRQYSTLCVKYYLNFQQDIWKIMKTLRKQLRVNSCR